MNNYKKYIFDLDYTILIPDWSMEDEYFKKYIPKEQQEEFFKQKQDILNEYEITHKKYDLKELSDFFESYGFYVSEKVIYGWMIHNGNKIIDKVSDGVKELFEYLKNNKKMIVVLTNWFSETQILRLKRAGLYKYIDKIVAGDDAMKPSLKAFELAIEDDLKDECIMIGDSIKSDKIGAQRAGIDCYIIDKEHTIMDFYNKLLSYELNNKKVEIK